MTSLADQRQSVLPHYCLKKLKGEKKEKGYYDKVEILKTDWINILPSQFEIRFSFEVIWKPLDLLVCSNFQPILECFQGHLRPQLRRDAEKNG